MFYVWRKCVLGRICSTFRNYIVDPALFSPERTTDRLNDTPPFYKGVINYLLGLPLFLCALFTGTSDLRNTTS